MALPTLVQHLSSASGNPGGFGQAGNVFRFQLPNAVLAGNCLVLGISYGFKATRTIAITDNNGNTWPAAAVEANAGAGSLISDIFVLPAANAGPTQITVTFDGGARTIAASPTGATEVGTTCTITTTTPHGLEVNDQIYIQGVGVAGYNGLNVFQVASVPTTTTFTYTNTVSGLAASGGGTVIVMVQPIQYKVSEYYNIATVSPVNGSSSGALTAAPNVSSGSFTPGNNDANGGNLIWSYFIDNTGGTANGATLFAPTGSFALLDADTSQVTQGIPHASEAFVQATSAAINPGMTVTLVPGTGDTFNVASVALKAAVAGTPPAATGIRIVHLCHFTSNQNTGVTAYHLQLPSAGNLIVLATHEQGGHDITSITDSKSNTYVLEEPDVTEPQIWHADNAKSDPDLRITVNVTGVLSGFTFFWYDIIGAAAAPVDGVVGSTGGNDVGGANIADQPIITPASIGLTIVALKMGIGPTSGFDTGAPAGAVFDAVWYPGETDSDALDNADGRGHVYNTDLTTEHWNWVVQNQSRDTSFASTAVHFKAAIGGAASIIPRRGPALRGPAIRNFISPRAYLLATPIVVPTFGYEAKGPERLPEPYRYDRSYVVWPPGPASQVVIVPKSPIPPTLLDRYPYPPWLDRSLLVMPPGNQSDLRAFQMAWTPSLLDRYPYPPWTDRTAMRLPPGTAVELVVVPKAPLAPSLPERYPYPAWTDRSWSVKPTTVPAAVAAPTWGYEGKGPERAPQPPQAERSALSVPVGPTSQVGPFGTAWTPLLPEKAPPPAWVDRSAQIKPPGSQSDLTATLKAWEPELPERYAWPTPLDRSLSALAAQQPAAAAPLDSWNPADPGRPHPDPWRDRSGIFRPAQVIAQPPAPLGSWNGLGLDRYPAPPWTDRSAIATALGPQSQVSDFRNLAWTPHLVERFPYPPWLDRSLAAVAPLQPPVAPLLSWSPLLPHRLLIALRGPPSIDAWAPVFPLPTVFLAFGSRYVLTLAQDSRTLALPQDARSGNLIQDNRAVALLTRS